MAKQDFLLLSTALVLGLAGLTCVNTANSQPLAARPQTPMTTIEKNFVYTVHADGSYVLEEFSKDRLNNALAVQRFGKAAISYSASRASVEVLKASTVTASGEHIAVDKTGIFTQQNPVSTNAPAFSDSKIKVIVFPQLAPGAIKVYDIRKTVTKPLFPNNFSMIQSFPSFGQFESARITLIAPKSMHMQVDATGFKGGQVKTDKRGMAKWVWTLKNPPIHAREIGSVSPIDYSPRVVASSFPNFQAAASAYLARANSKARITKDVQKLADKLTRDVKEPRQQAKAIYDWVSENIRYVALNFGYGGVVPRAADTILKSGYGDCKDHVVLLRALLAAKGIESNPVFINAGTVYWQPKIAAFPGVYNHAITYVPKFHLFLDSTAQVAPFGALVPTEFGKPVLVARTAGGKAKLTTIPLPSPSANSTRVETTVDIAKDGTAKGHSTVEFNGATGVVVRALMHEIPQTLTAQVANKLMAAFGQSGHGSLSAGDPTALDQAFALQTTFAMPNFAVLPGPGAFPVPLGVPSPAAIAGFARSTSAPKRLFAMPCAPTQKLETTTIDLPKDIKVARLPRKVAVKNSLGQYSASYQQEGQVIHVTRELTLTPSKATCDPQDYQKLRALGQAAARDNRAQIFY